MDININDKISTLDFVCIYLINNDTQSFFQLVLDVEVSSSRYLVPVRLTSSMSAYTFHVYGTVLRSEASTKYMLVQGHGSITLAENVINCK